MNPTAPPPPYEKLNNPPTQETNFSPSYQPQRPTIYVQQQYGQHPNAVLVSGLPPLGPQPANVTCPNCAQQGLTDLRYENATKTHLMALLLCVFGLCCCAPIPYCVDSCRNANHYCKSCGQYLGTHLNNSC